MILRLVSRVPGRVRLRSVGAARQTRAHFATARQALATAAFVVIAGSSSVLACPVCFGAEETSMIDATKLGMLVMLAITVAVQGGFVGFFLYLRKRANRHAEHELDAEWSDIQRPSRT